MSVPDGGIRFVIAPLHPRPTGSDLLPGDEPADLSRERLRLEPPPPGDPAGIVFPAKGEVPPSTTPVGEDAGWLLRRAEPMAR